MGESLYSCTEQRYFAAKAALLGDDERLARIMSAKDPAKMLYEGKRVVNYSKEDWEAVQEKEMKAANRNKYAQNPAARAALLATGKTIIAEASKDGTWGIGYAMNDKDKVQQLTWKKNKLGYMLMDLRSEFTT